MEQTVLSKRANSWELVGQPFRSVVDTVAGHLHAGQELDAARAAIEAVRMKGDLDSPKFRLQVLQGLLAYLLSNRHYLDSAVLLWPENMFFSRPMPRYTKLVWGALDSWDGLMFQGGASTSKSYGCGVYFFLDWLADPLYTTVRVAGPGETHLQDNLFSHLVNLHQNAAIPLPGKVGDLFIGLDLRNRRSAISGVVFPMGRKPSGRLQGVKRFPRPRPHPVFGPLSRLRILLDEVEHMPIGVWSDLDNVLANTDEADREGLKIASAFNPKDPAGACGVRAEPPGGHENTDPDKDETWTSKRGWLVVRLDGEKCENFLEDRIVFPGLQTRGGLARLAQSTGGTTSANYQTFGRAMFPKQGAKFSVIPADQFAAAKGEFIWSERPQRAAGGDLALEGGDKPILAFGEWGLAIGYKSPPSLLHPTGEVVRFLDKNGRQTYRWALQCSSILELEPGKTETVSRQIREACYRAGVEPEWLCLDRTGNGAGVCDLLKSLWSARIIDVNYSQSCSEFKIMEEDTLTCKERYDRLNSEMWFALARFIEFGVFRFSPLVNTTEIVQQFTGRLYDPRLKDRVESKRDYSSRNGGKSPDEADAVTLLVNAVRRASGILPSAFSTAGARREEIDDNPIAICDITNRLDGLL